MAANAKTRAAMRRPTAWMVPMTSPLRDGILNLVHGGGSAPPCSGGNAAFTRLRAMSTSQTLPDSGAAAAVLQTPPAAAKTVRSLSGLLPFLRPYRGRIVLALLFLVLAAVSTLVFPIALKSLIDQGLVAAEPGQRLVALREHFFALFAVG